MANWGWKYDVFLSFRGEDTRYKFTDHLYHAFLQVGINVFMDGGELGSGEEIGPSLLRAIEDSRISIVVFSKSYASSTWCLDELVKILECKKEKQQLVLPIFYNVDPSEIRHQKEGYGNAMAAHEERFRNNIEKVHKWRSALWRATNISGESYRDGSEHDFIQMIVAKVSRHLDHLPLHITEKPVGLESRIFEVVSLLGNGSDDEHDVRMIGIYGIGGIGKTTIAKAIYNMIAYKFENTSFVANVRETSTKQGLVHIQEAILADILGKQDIKLSNIHKGVQIMKERLHSKKILLILDDVNDLQQLHSLAGGTDWFGLGSRVIITTRDKHLLERCCGERMYEVKELDAREALELFCWNAFGKCTPTTGFAEISADLIHYAQGNPLALEIIGSDLFGKDKDEWECTLDKYKKTMNKHIFGILENSHENLEYDEKEIFLDIACFFKGNRWDHNEKILEGCGFNAKSGLRVLRDKCLIKKQDGCMWMHDLIQSFGREVVRQESEREPGRRSRIWFHKDALQVLTRDTGTRKIQGLMLEMPQKKEVKWSGNSFKKMVNLRILIIRNAIFLKPLEYLPNSLIVLEWEEYPSSSLPPNFDGDELLYLGMPRSTHVIHMKQLFMSQNVVIMNFGKCSCLVEVPNLSALQNLEELDLFGCVNLVKIDDSVRSLPKLKRLTLSYCRMLRTFPTGDGWKALSFLSLRGCHLIETLPVFSQMKSLNLVDFADTRFNLDCDIFRRARKELLDAHCNYICSDAICIPSFAHPHNQYRIKNKMLTVGSSNTCTALSIESDYYSGVSSLDPLCKKVCSLNIPDQVKHFARTAIYDDLPSKWNLTWYGYRLEGVKCDRCKLAEETSIHVLKRCQWARGVWLLCPLGLRVDRMRAKSFRNWLSQLVSILNTESLELFLALAWGLWTERDKMRSGRKTEDAMCLIHRINVLLEEYRRMHKPVRKDADADNICTVIPMVRARKRSKISYEDTSYKKRKF